MARTVENIAENKSSQLFDKKGRWMSQWMLDTSQVYHVYIRGVDEVHEELLYMYSIHGSTTGIDIFKGIELTITTDGGKNMSGKHKGVVVVVIRCRKLRWFKTISLTLFIHQS